MKRLVLALPLLLFACGDKAPEARPDAQPALTASPVPDRFRVLFETSKGNFVVEIHRAWAPIGVERFYDLVNIEYFADARFFRVLPGFVVQFGMHADPAVNEKWSSLRLQDEPVRVPNRRGTLVFAKQSVPNTRSNQFFINLGDNSGSLDPQGFSPIGEVVEGMDVVDRISAEYGERPEQGAIAAQGNAYLMREFPRMDFIKSANIVR